MEKLLKNKKGWLRIVEAVAGILIVAGVLLTMYVRNVQKGDISEYAIGAEQKVLNDVSLSTDLRKDVLTSNVAGIFDYINQTLPSDLAFEIRVCDVDSACGMVDEQNIKDSLNKEVFVQEKLVSSVIDSSGNAYFCPQQVKLFVWQGARTWDGSNIVSPGTCGGTTSGTGGTTGTEGECVENWSCLGDWSQCSEGTQTQTCWDWNSCGTTVNKPLDSQSCDIAPGCNDTCSSLGYECGTQTICGESSYCGENSFSQFCYDGLGDSAITKTCNSGKWVDTGETCPIEGGYIGKHATSFTVTIHDLSRLSIGGSGIQDDGLRYSWDASKSALSSNNVLTNLYGQDWEGNVVNAHCDVSNTYVYPEAPVCSDNNNPVTFTLTSSGYAKDSLTQSEMSKISWTLSGQLNGWGDCNCRAGYYGMGWTGEAIPNQPIFPDSVDYNAPYTMTFQNGNIEVTPNF